MVHKNGDRSRTASSIAPKWMWDEPNRLKSPRWSVGEQKVGQGNRVCPFVEQLSNLYGSFSPWIKVVGPWDYQKVECFRFRIRFQEDRISCLYDFHGRKRSIQVWIHSAFIQVLLMPLWKNAQQTPIWIVLSTTIRLSVRCVFVDKDLSSNTKCEPYEYAGIEPRYCLSFHRSPLGIIRSWDTSEHPSCSPRKWPNWVYPIITVPLE